MCVDLIELYFSNTLNTAMWGVNGFYQRVMKRSLCRHLKTEGTLRPTTKRRGEVCVRMFNSNTEGDEVNGFNAQEEDGET